ncbi:hypothetical protein E2562_019720 [Oryza meyeriana var. granulata]|uniref:DUF4283 domain-containing protein n=1 Tax=Oryza meyeriana var. granulata TaxID=110450 RepID=A0A6G1C6Z8_9ORYZ|nr:hypothetical protein E2562_019720 [Oryza meyeriana var. granulata]
MERKEAWLKEHSLLASVLGSCLSVSPGKLVEAIRNHAGMCDHNFRVVVTSTDDFLITFRHLRDRNTVFRRLHDIFCNEVPISFKLWSRRSWWPSSELSFFTKILLDGLLMHMWEQEVVRNLVNKLDGELVELIPTKDACCLGLFSWFKKPLDLLQLIDVEVLEKASAGGPRREGTSSLTPSAPRAKPTLVYCFIIHVEEVIDPTPLYTSDIFPDDNFDDNDVVH